jgi:hypothetical protein
MLCVLSLFGDSTYNAPPTDVLRSNTMYSCTFLTPLQSFLHVLIWCIYVSNVFGRLEIFSSRDLLYAALSCGLAHHKPIRFFPDVAYPSLRCVVEHIRLGLEDGWSVVTVALYESLSV